MGQLHYVAFLSKGETRLEGTIEKIFESSVNGDRSFVGAQRARGTLTGTIEQRLFGSDVVSLQIVESGHGRESSNFHTLRVTSKDLMSGRFVSMVADQAGSAIWQRTQFAKLNSEERPKP